MVVFAFQGGFFTLAVAVMVNSLSDIIPRQNKLRILLSYKFEFFKKTTRQKKPGDILTSLESPCETNCTNITNYADISWSKHRQNYVFTSYAYRSL